MRCKSLQRISNPAIHGNVRSPFNRRRGVTSSRTTHPRSKEISIANLGDSAVLLHLPLLAICGGASRRRLYDRSFARYRSLSLFVLLGRISPADRLPEGPPTFNECHPADVLQVSIFTTRFGNQADTGERREGENGTKRAAITIGEFLLLCLLRLPTRLAASQALSRFFFSTRKLD